MDVIWVFIMLKEYILTSSWKQSANWKYLYMKEINWFQNVR
jgi:hypothetical protein